MFYRKSIMIMAVAVLLLTSAPAKANLEQPLSTWLWNTASIQTNSTQILTFLEQKQVDKLYLQIDTTLLVETYKQFIKKAAEKNISVYALDGAPNWVSAKGSTYLNQYFTWLNNYQKTALAGEKFAGVHLDVEPYLFSGWNTNYKNTVLAYQNLMSNALQLAKPLGLPVEADIPFWFDEKTYSNKYGKGTLSEWMIKNTAGVTIMAYRDHAEGANGISALVNYEYDLAKKLNKPLTIAVETMQSNEADTVSFYEEGEASMKGQLSIVESTYGQYEKLGFAIHHLDSWMNMKP